MLILAAASAAPVALWETLGLLHGGPLTYVLGSYAGAHSPYGHGSPLYYVAAFARADPLLLFPALGAGVLATVSRRRMPRTTRLAASQALFYFVVLSVMWARGSMGLAGLLRYFVVAYPAYLLAGGWFLDKLGTYIRDRRTGLVVVAIVVVVQGLELRRVYRPPTYEANEITSLLPSELGSYPYLQLARLRASLGGKEVIADRPEILYYLGASRSIYEAPKPDKVRDPGLRGIFGFVEGWSEGYGMHLDDFKGLSPLVHLEPGIYLFERP